MDRLLSSLAFVLTLALVLPMAASGQVYPDADRTLTPDADVRNYSEEGEYFIFFVERASQGSITGHAYVAWIAHNPRQNVNLQYARGLYATGSGLEILEGSVSKMDAGIMDEALTGGGPVRDRFVVQVNSREFDRAKYVMRDWSRAGSYNLLYRNCVHFIEAVAQEIGLRTPSANYDTPAGYVDDLRDANR